MNLELRSIQGIAKAVENKFRGPVREFGTSMALKRARRFEKKRKNGAKAFIFKLFCKRSASFRRAPSNKTKVGKIMEEAKHICVYSGSAYPELSQQIANYLRINLGKVHITHFPDGEIFAQFEENVRRADAFLIQPTCNAPNDNLMELLIMIDAARRASAARITAVLPYFGYARQDRKDKPRVPITAKLVANLLTCAGADRVLTMDLHAQQIQGFFEDRKSVV